jgi:ferrochelatase
MREMTRSGVKKALAVVLAAYSSYSSCRQYREDIGQAQEEVGSAAPLIDKTRVFYNHPEFIAANSDRVREALARIPSDERPRVQLIFTAHSLPMTMAKGSSYEVQLKETSRLVADEVGVPSDRWNLVYQSRSGRPEDAWLEPDVLDHLRRLKNDGKTHVIIHPIGFLSDHIEVLYDLDQEARQVCEEIGLTVVRSRTVGTHRGFVRMLRELIDERVAHAPVEERRAVGAFGPGHDTCPIDCCLPPARSVVRSAV